MNEIKNEEQEVVEDSEEFAQVTSEDIDEIQKNIKLKDVDVPLEESELSKQKVEKTKEEQDTVDDETLKLYEEFGDFLKLKADVEPDQGIKRLIPTGLDLLDAALGGGFPVGAFTMIVGTPGSGKSMLAMQAMGAGQRKYKGLIASFLDSEEATTTERLYNLGVRYPAIKPYNDVTIEKLFKHLETICLFKEQKKIIENPSVLVWDSIANTLSQKEREVEDINSVIGYKARLLSLLVPKYVAKCAKYNIAWIAVNQMREQLAMGNFAPAKELRHLSAGKSIPGGQSIKYNAFTLLELKSSSALSADKDYGFDGIVSTVTTVKNKIMAPNIQVELVGNFVMGFSNFWTNYRFMVKNKYIKAASWSSLESFPDKKFRTKDALGLYQTDEKFREAFDKSKTECIEAEIINKYKPDI